MNIVPFMKRNLHFHMHLVSLVIRAALINWWRGGVE